MRAVSASGDRTLRVWDLSSGRTLHPLRGHARDVYCVAVAPHGATAVSASADATLRVWDLRAGRNLHALKGHTGPVFGVTVTPDGKRALSTSADRTLRLWDLESGRHLAGFECDDRARSFTVSPDGRTVVVGDASGLIYVLGLSSEEEQPGWSR